MDWKIELIAIPVLDVDRAKAFYVENAGFNADHDHRVSDDIRFVQLTPPGSACSIVLGKGITEEPSGSVQGVQMVVSDINAARAELVERGVDVGEVQVFRRDRSSSSRIRTTTAGPCRSYPRRPSPLRCL